MRNWKKSGMTLVEALISIAIIGIAFGGLMYATVNSQYLLNSSSNRAEIWNLLTSRHEECSDWSETYLSGMLSNNNATVTLTETPTDLYRQGLLADSAMRYSVIDRTTIVSRTNNLYTMSIQVRWRQSRFGALTTNLQETCLIYMTPRW